MMKKQAEANHRAPWKDRHGDCSACGHPAYRHEGFFHPSCESCEFVAEGLPADTVAIRPSTWAYGPSFITQSYLLEAPEKTLERMKAAAANDALEAAER